MIDDSDINKRREERADVTLLVEYEGADDLVGDFTANLSSGGTFVSTTREIPLGAKVRLILSFPGLLEPVAVDGEVRWIRSDEDAGVGIAFFAGPSRDRLAQVVDRIRARDPHVVLPVVRVLVVEDNPHVAELIREGLRGSAKRGFDEELAFKFSSAENGREALELLANETFDAVIIDVYLPIIDGPQVITQARRDMGLTNLPFIAVSAGGEGAKAAALAAGANIFLDKPMRLRQVIETMRRLIRLQR